MPAPWVKKSTHLNVLISHSYVVCICCQIFRSGHHGELYGPLVQKGFVGPFPYRSYLFDCSNAVVCNEHLQR